jgi:hypothetical protein
MFMKSYSFEDIILNVKICTMTCWIIQKEKEEKLHILYIAHNICAEHFNSCGDYLIKYREYREGILNVEDCDLFP